MINAQRTNEVATLLKNELPGLGFALIVFDFGGEERVFRYISNAQRADMVAALQGVLDKWKQMKDENN